MFTSRCKLHWCLSEDWGVRNIWDVKMMLELYRIYETLCTWTIQWAYLASSAYCQKEFHPHSWKWSKLERKQHGFGWCHEMFKNPQNMMLLNRMRLFYNNGTAIQKHSVVIQTMNIIIGVKRFAYDVHPFWIIERHHVWQISMWSNFILMTKIFVVCTRLSK